MSQQSKENIRDTLINTEVASLKFANMLKEISEHVIF